MFEGILTGSGAAIRAELGTGRVSVVHADKGRRPSPVSVGLKGCLELFCAESPAEDREALLRYADPAAIRGELADKPFFSLDVRVSETEERVFRVTFARADELPDTVTVRFADVTGKGAACVYSHILESQANGVLCYRLRDHSLIYMNAEALRIYGWRDLEEAREHIEKGDYMRVRIFTEGILPRLKSLTPDGDYAEYEFLANENGEQPIHALARTRLITGFDGEPAIVSTFHDITNLITLENEKRLTRESEQRLSEMNARLRENQHRLEEALTAQKAQLKHIMELNTELEDRQRVLEERSKRDERLQETTAEAIHGGFKTGKNDACFTFNYVSKQLAAMLGYTVEEFLQASGGTMAGIVNLTDVRREIPGALESIAKGEMYTMNYRMRCKDGSWKNVEDRGRLIRTPGREDEFWCFISDRDELTAKTHALEQAQQRMSIIQTVLKGYYAAYYIDLERDSYIELVSVEPIRSLIAAESSAQNALYKIGDTIITEEFRPAVREFFDLSTLPGRLMSTDTVSLQLTGHILGWSQLFLIAGERAADGRPKSVLLCARVINDEKERELSVNRRLEAARQAAENANNAKTEFLFNMSHDIRTPMSAIIGFADLLDKHINDPEKRADYLRKLKDSGTVLLSILNNVLEMARIEKGKLQLDEQPCDIFEVNRAMSTVFADQMERKGIRFISRMDVQHTVVCCDPIKLREIFLNILSNAFKYTNPGGTVTQLCEEIPSQHEGMACYRTTISDTGIGMSEDYLPHLFEEFSREHNTTENKIEGAGLGMPIVKRLVQLMNGTIEVSSRQGEGTTFVVTLHHRIADSGTPAQSESAAAVPQDFSGRRILLAEDNDLNAEIAMELLSCAGFEAERAENGEVCVRMLENAPAGYYDLILMDIQMPVMNGYEAARAIRAMTDRAKADIPILALTANAFEEDRRKALQMGMNGHLAKPIDIKLLVREAARVMK